MGDATGVTGLLLAWSGGDRSAGERLLPLVYDELRKLAAFRLVRERAGHTLVPTALVHEAYLRLVQQDRVQWQNRAQFFGLAAELMRRILVDQARARHAQKRGDPALRVTLTDSALAAVPAGGDGLDLCLLDEALHKLAALDAAQARLVELRFFAGLTIEEAALVLGTSPATVKREWSLARAWLRRELESHGG